MGNQTVGHMGVCNERYEPTFRRSLSLRQFQRRGAPHLRHGEGPPIPPLSWSGLLGIALASERILGGRNNPGKDRSGETN
ncbi:hypothetical protein NicSoilC5_02760 [Arthrobacter sp. NicSoilC5]|nr:hypothetical protein NicSoilC5_02760 [Arthrobacter sp. NicSoilC5]